jgi:hypothetical protein
VWWLVAFEKVQVSILEEDNVALIHHGKDFQTGIEEAQMMA